MDLTDRLSAWAAAGYGAGEVAVTPEGGAALKADLTMAMGRGLATERGAAARGRRGPVPGAAKGDARFARTASGEADGGRMAAAEADAWLVRAGVEGSRRFALRDGGDGAALTPSFELGARLDGGDAETGFGADVGGGSPSPIRRTGSRWTSRRAAWSPTRRRGSGNWGASAALAWDPRPETGRGLALSLRRSRGAAPAGGMDALLNRETLAGLAANDDAGGGGAGRRAA